MSQPPPAPPPGGWPPPAPGQQGWPAPQQSQQGWPPPQQSQQGWPPPQQAQQAWPPPQQGWPPPQQTHAWPPPHQGQQGWPAPQQGMQAWPPGQAPQQGMHAWLPPGQVQQAWPPLEFGPPTRSGPVGDWPPPTTQPVPGPEPAAAAPEPAASVTAVATLERPEPIPSEALDHPVFFDPAPAVAWWHKQRGALRGRIVSLVLSVVIWAALWWFTREPDNALGWQWGPLSWWIAGISVGVSVLMIVWAAVQFRRAKRAVAALHEGLALGIGRGGLYLDDTLVRWPDLAGLDVHPGRLGGSARLVVRTASGANHTLPLDHLAATPASIDGAIRALSGGRAWLDLTRLDD